MIWGLSLIDCDLVIPVSSATATAVIKLSPVIIPQRMFASFNSASTERVSCLTLLLNTGQSGLTHFNVLTRNKLRRRKLTKVQNREQVIDWPIKLEKFKIQIIRKSVKLLVSDFRNSEGMMKTKPGNRLLTVNFE